MISGCGASTSGAGSDDAEAEDPAAATTRPDDKDDQGGTGDKSGKGGEAPSRADLDAYVTAGERAMESMLGPGLKKLYESVDIEPVYPDGIEYVYVFKKEVDAVRGSTALKKQTPVLRASSRTQIVPEMKRLGFDDPSVTWTYRNPDGSTIWTLTVP